MYNSLRNYIETLEMQDQLVRIKEYLNPELEITEVADRLVKHHGPAILIENNGTKFPLLINAFGTLKRTCIALGVKSLEDIPQEINNLFQQATSPRHSFLDKLKLLPLLKEVSQWMPVTSTKKGCCQDIVNHTPNLNELPILKCWPHDGGKFITLPLVHTMHPETKIRNIGMYRMHVYDETTTGMHWHRHKGGAAHYNAYKTLNQRMPVSVVLGGDPVYTYVATAPLPDNIDEYLLAGFLRKQKVQLVKCITNDLYVPADADFVIEGYIDTNEPLKTEGPFGDHTGFYSLEDEYPVFHITCITHRKDAVYPTTIVGIPPMEDAYLGKATERIFLAPIRLAMLPEITDMVMPVEGVFHNIVLVSIKKQYPGHAQKVMNALWGAGQMMFNKILVIVDDTINITHPKEVINAIAQHVQINHDLHISKGPLDVLDHAAPATGLGSKLGVDATQKWKEEIHSEIKSPKHGFPFKIIAIDKADKNIQRHHQTLEKTGYLKDIDYIIYVDENVPVDSYALITWYAANNLEPGRDIYYNDTKNLVGFDATRKTPKHDNFHRGWPNPVTSTLETIDIIDKKWNQLNLGKLIPSPSLTYLPIVKPGGARIIE